jgi:hypothetical protein
LLNRQHPTRDQLLLTLDHFLERLVRQLLPFKKTLVGRGGLLLKRLHRPQPLLHHGKHFGRRRGRGR